MTSSTSLLLISSSTAPPSTGAAAGWPVRLGDHHGNLISGPLQGLGYIDLGFENWQPALLGSLERAMLRTPRSCGVSLNSASML